MKICIIAEELTYKGGVQNYSSNLIMNMLAEQSIDEILVICDEVDTSVYKTFKTDKLRIFCIGRPQKSDLLRVVFRNIKYTAFSKYISKYDIVHILDDRALPLITHFTNPLVVTIHDVMLSEFIKQMVNVWLFGLRKIPRFIDHYCPQLFLELFSILKSSRLIINTQIVADRLMKSYGNLATDKVCIIPPGFDHKVFNPHFMTRSQARHHLKLDPSVKMILVVGGDTTSSGRKGLPYVLRALDLLRKNGLLDKHKIFLYLIGEYPEKLRRQYSHLNNYIRQKQYVNESLLPIFYRASDLFIMASSSEGWGMALIEALACGTPAIASRYVPSAFAAECTGAVYIENHVEDPRIFACSILKGLFTSQDKEWDKIFEFLVFNFSWTTICKLLVRIYSKLDHAC